MRRQAQATAVLGGDASCSYEGNLYILLDLLIVVYAGSMPPAFAGVRCVQSIRSATCVLLQLPTAVISEVRMLL